MSSTGSLKSSLFLLTTAIIWGLAFVAQKVGGDFIGGFTFNGIRFLLGGLSLLPLVWFNRRQWRRQGRPVPSFRAALPGGLLMGLILCAAASIQQLGISPSPGVMGTTPAKAAFITGLYILLVPIIGLWLKHRAGLATWLGAGLAFVGLFFLTIQNDLTVSGWDLLELAGTPLWALHILVIDQLSKRHDALYLSLIQTVVCGLVSLVLALGFEPLHLSAILNAAVPILYAGIGSVGIAYTLQVIGQKQAPPALAAIILSLETVFAALGGWLILGQTMDLRQSLGAALMLLGMILPQLWHPANPPQPKAVPQR